MYCSDPVHSCQGPKCASDINDPDSIMCSLQPHAASGGS